MDVNNAIDGIQKTHNGTVSYTHRIEPVTLRISLACIQPDPLNPRRHFDRGALQELADSIRANGVIQAPAVRPHPDPDLRAQGGFMLIAGERRWRASMIAGLAEVRCDVYDGIDELEVRRLQLTENFGRKDLNVVEEAEALQATIEDLAAKGYPAPQRMLATVLGMDETSLSRKLRVLRYSVEVRALVRDGIVTQVNALGALEKLLPIQRQSFVEYARGQAADGKPTDVAGFLRDPKKFLDRVRQAKSADSAPPSPSTIKPGKPSQWVFRWAVGRGEFLRLIETTGFQVDLEEVRCASDEELRKHFDAFRAWMLNIGDVTESLEG